MSADVTTAIGDVVPFAVLAAALRLAVFTAALLAHRRWKIPIPELERLIKACFPGSRGR